MRIKINKLNVATKKRKNIPNLELGDEGMELAVYSDKKHKGDLVVTSKKVIWCDGKTTPPFGNSATWDELIELMKKFGKNLK